MTPATLINGITLRKSPLTRGGWECWVCDKFTPVEVEIVTSRGLRRLPCCSVECYGRLAIEYEKFVQWQGNDCLCY